MKRETIAVGAVMLAVFGWPAVAGAQETAPEDAVSPGVEAEDEREADEDEPLVWDFRLTSEIHSSDNVGLRELDLESGDQERIETDDRHTFSYTSLALGVDYQVMDDTRFVAGASHNGLWGSNQLGGTNEFDSFFFVYDLHIDWDAVDVPGFGLNAKLGRQFFEIGGTHRDFFFSDQIDGLTLEADFEEAGTVRLMPLDLYASQGRPDNVNFLQWHTGRDMVYNMQGETNTFRFGGVYEQTELIDPVEFRAFGFYSTIGAAGTGADRTHEGTLGNFSDNDFVWMTGTRLGYFEEFGDDIEIGVVGDYAYSGGIDRKEVNIGVPDVDIGGHAFGGSLLGEVMLQDTAVDGVVQYFRADGPTYGEDGLMENHGFVSFRGNYTGGLNQSRYGGWRPTSYIGQEGIHHSEHDIQRESGTEFVHAGVGVGLPVGLRLDVGAWQYWDTGGTQLSEGNREEAGDRLPSGYSRDELQAQDRLGRDLGLELNTSLSFAANDALMIYGMGGVFLPGSFYEHEITRNVGSSRGSADNLQNFWAVSAGATLNF